MCAMKLLCKECFYLCLVLSIVTGTDIPSLSRWISTEQAVVSEDEAGYNCSISTIDSSEDCESNYTDTKCTLCCPFREIKCCLEFDRDVCWNREWQHITMTQVSVSILFLLGIMAIIILFFKICSRYSHAENSTINLLPNQRRPDQASLNSIQSVFGESFRDQPPPYTPTTCEAPPLYNAPCNRASMLEPPPGYPGTPEARDRNVHRVTSSVQSVLHI